jgi:hypothetical protein
LLAARALGDDDRSGRDAEGLMGPAMRRSEFAGSCLRFTSLIAPLLTSLALAGPVAAQQPTSQARADALVAEAIDKYHGERSEIGQRAALIAGAWDDRHPPTCTGLSLDDCFGGDLFCAWLGTMCNGRASAAERQLLIGRLEGLVREYPGNEAAIGQLVDQALIHGDRRRAWDAAEACRAALWWCQSLRGYVRHDAAPGSGSAQLDSAVAGAPQGIAAFITPPDPLIPDRGLDCEWNDVGHLLSGALLDEYKRSSCNSDRAFTERFWWLSDPLWSVPGNERRSEHLVRYLRMRLHYQYENFATGPKPRTHWASSQARHPEWTREGFQNSWHQVSRILNGREETRAEPYVNGGYSFAPDESRLRDPLRSTAQDWAVTWNEGSERMITRERWHNVEEIQAAILRRGDRLQAVTAGRLPEAASSAAGARAALAMGRPADLEVEQAAAAVESDGVVRAVVDIPDGEWVASLEILGEGWVGRARFGAPARKLAANGFGMSDPVLVEERFESGDVSLNQAMLPSTRLSAGGRVGLYFEVYGVEASESLRIAVAAERTDASFFSRIKSALRLTSAVALELDWSEAADTPMTRLMQRYLTLDLAGLDPGEYRLKVAVERSGGAVASSTRMITLW